MHGLACDVRDPVTWNEARGALQTGSIDLQEAGSAQVPLQLVWYVAHVIECAYPGAPKHRCWLITFHTGGIGIAHPQAGHMAELMAVRVDDTHAFADAF
jgi:hypothetical protein